MWMNQKTVRIIAWAIVVIFILGIFFMASSSFGQELDSQQKLEPLKFSLEEAKNYAEEHNLDLQIAKIEKADVELAKKISEDAQNMLNDNYGTMKYVDTFDWYKARNGYSVLAIKNTQKLLDLGNELKQKGIEVAVEAAYYDLSEKGLVYDLKKKTLEQIKNQVKIAEQKLSLGNVSEVEYKKVLLQQTTAEMEEKNASVDYYNARMGFNKQLNLPLDQEIILTSKVEYQKYDMPTFEAKLEQRKNQDVGYVNLILDKDLIAVEDKLTSVYYGGKSNVSKQVTNKAKKNEVAIQKQSVELEYRLKSEQKKISAMEDTIKTCEEAVALSNTVYEITKLKESLGMATNLDVIDAELKCMEAEIKQIQAVHGYKALVLKFEKNVTVSNSEASQADNEER